MQQKNPKSKILLLGYLPPPQEGTAKVTETILNSNLIKNNFFIYFISLYKRDKPSLRGKLSLINIYMNVMNILRFIYAIITFKPNLIHLTLAQNKFGFVKDSLFIIISKIFKKDIVVHFHGGNFDLFYQTQNKFIKKYIRFTLRKIDNIIVLAESIKRQFNNIINNKNIFVLYNSSPYIPKNIEKIKNDRFTMLFIAYISKAKGALDIVKSIPIILSKYSGDFELILCGQGVDIERNITFIPDPNYGYSKILKFIEENQLDKYIKILGPVDEKTKNSLFRKSHLFLFPSYSDGCGLVVLEAMSYGLPVIVTPVGALAEILKEGINCLFVKPGDYKGLAEKILFLMNNPDIRNNLSKNNRNLICERFNTEIFCKNLFDIWYNILLS